MKQLSGDYITVYAVIVYLKRGVMNIVMQYE